LDVMGSDGNRCNSSETDSGELAEIGAGAVGMRVECKLSGVRIPYPPPQSGLAAFVAAGPGAV